MFGMGRRKSREMASAASASPTTGDEIATEIATEIVTAPAAVDVSAPVDVDEPVDRMFMAMIAALDVSLADLSRTCDRIEQLVAG